MKRNHLSGVSQAIKATLNSAKAKSALVGTVQPGTFSIKIANTLEEREEVFRLAYQVYLDKGYTAENYNQWLVKPYDANADTTILMVKDASNKIIGSVTLVFDQYNKLPADKIYGEELNALRKKGKRLVEISRLVIKPDYRNSKEILVLLFNYLSTYIYQVRKWDMITIEVNPRHKNYYKELLHFEEIGSEKNCPQVQNAPAILMILPSEHYFHEINKPKSENDKKTRSLYPYFLSKEKEVLAIEYLRKQAKPISQEEKMYFGFSESGKSKAVCV